MFNKRTEAEAEQQLRVTAAKIGEAPTRVANSGKRTLVLTYNDSNFSSTEQPVIYSVLQAPRALPAPAPVAPARHASACSQWTSGRWSRLTVK